MHIALYQPAIPPNTGNIARQCVGMKASLHLIRPLGFDIDDAAVKRAGLDHWDHLDLTVHESGDAFLDWLGDRTCWAVTKFGSLRYDRAQYGSDDVLLFGNENRGLPDAWHTRFADRAVHIPILGKVRSYNLSNAVSLVMGQAYVTAGMYDAAGPDAAPCPRNEPRP